MKKIILFASIFSISKLPAMQGNSYQSILSPKMLIEQIIQMNHDDFKWRKATLQKLPSFCPETTDYNKRVQGQLDLNELKKLDSINNNLLLEKLKELQKAINAQEEQYSGSPLLEHTDDIEEWINEE